MIPGGPFLHSDATRPSLVRRVLSKARRYRASKLHFDSSAKYWEDRYRRGGNSGSGSYNRLAQFKADVLNEFVAENDLKTVIEFGSGDGAQLSLADYQSYVGVDISPTAVAAAREAFRSDPSKRFLHTSEVTDDRADVALSLDVVYHLVEDEVFDAYMTGLFNAALRYAIVYASNRDSAWPSPHVRHREFTRWVDENRPDFRLLTKIRNRYPYSDLDPDNTSFADFYIFERINV